MPAATDVAANIYRWERGTVTPSDRYRLYYCHTLGIPPDRFGDPSWDPAQDVPRVIITISLPEGTDTQIKLASTEPPRDRWAHGSGGGWPQGVLAAPIMSRSDRWSTSGPRTYGASRANADRLGSDSDSE